MEQNQSSHNAGIMKHWGTIVWIVAVVFWGGVFYAEQRSIRNAVNTIDEKVNKQYETLRRVNEDQNEIEKWVEFHKGYEQARKDYRIKP